MKQYATVITKSVNLRDKPNGEDIGEVLRGDKLEVLERKQGKQYLWLRVKVGRKTGWVAASPKWVKLNPVEMPPPDVEPIPAPEPYDYTPLWISGGLLVAGLVALFLGGWL